MPAIKIELVQSSPFLAGNLAIARTQHQTDVNAFLATVTDPQNILALQTVLQPLGTQFVFTTSITYYQP